MKRVGSIAAAIGLFLFAQTARADWGGAQRLTWTAGDSYYPGIAVDSAKTIHVVWWDDTPGNPEIYYLKGH
jgi:hypothetical protein